MGSLIILLGPGLDFSGSIQSVTSKSPPPVVCITHECVYLYSYYTTQVQQMCTMFVTLLLLPVTPTTITSLNGSWNHFNTYQLRHRHARLSHYVITLSPSQSAELFCNSPDMEPHVGLTYSNTTISTVPKEQLLAGHPNQLNKVTPCELGDYKRGPKDWRAYQGCVTRALYSVQDVWWNCGFTFPSHTNIRVVTTPARHPYHYPKPPLTDHLEWWCLRDRNITFVEAGHLLWFYGVRVNVTSPEPRPQLTSRPPASLQVVERFPSWELERGDLFECNGTIWRWAYDYPCLKMLPTGWPALSHCHKRQGFLMILCILILFLFLYCNIMAAYHAYGIVKRACVRYINKKRGPRVKVPLIPKDPRAPFSHMNDITMLVNKPSSESESSD